MASEIPSPHTTATCQSPVSAPVNTATCTEPSPKKTRMNVPITSAAHSRASVG